MQLMKMYLYKRTISGYRRQCIFTRGKPVGIDENVPYKRTQWEWLKMYNQWEFNGENVLLQEDTVGMAENVQSMGINDNAPLQGDNHWEC